MHTPSPSALWSTKRRSYVVTWTQPNAAAEILPTLPKDQLNKVARFLESKGNSSCVLHSMTLHL